MKLVNLENKYISLYRITILFVISLALVITIAASIYAIAKFSGILAKSNQEVIEKNTFEEPDINKFKEKYEEKEPKNLELKLEEPKDTQEQQEQQEDNSNKNILFKQQAERIASLQKAFIEEQKKEFADLELETLKRETLKLISLQRVLVFCDKNNEDITKAICENTKFEVIKRKNGSVLKLDTIDISTYSKEFYEKEINFFELQYSFISDFLTNPKTVELYSKGQIESPTIEAVTEFFNQFIDNNNAYWVKRNANIEAEKQNKQNYEFKKMQDKAESFQILMFAGGAFGVFILIMFFVIFYRIERNLNTISELNTNMLDNMKK